MIWSLQGVDGELRAYIDALRERQAIVLPRDAGRWPPGRNYNNFTNMNLL